MIKMVRDESHLPKGGYCKRQAGQDGDRELPAAEIRKKAECPWTVLQGKGAHGSQFPFVRSERSTIDHIKTFSLPYLRYATTTTDGRRTIMTVPEKQMQSFIAVAGDEEQQAIYLDPASVDLSKGDKVRIIGGQLAGVEGTFMKIKGGNRVVVKIDFVAAVATAEIPPQLIEKL